MAGTIDRKVLLVNTNGDAVVDDNVVRMEFQPDDADGIKETLQNAAAATGVGTAIDVKGYSVSVDVQISATATVTFKVTVDDTNYRTVGLIKALDGTVVSAVVSSAASGVYYLPAGLKASQLIAEITSFSSGTVTALSIKHPR